MQYGNLILLTFNAPWVPAPATRPPPSTNPVLATGRQEGGVACVPKHALIALLCISLSVLLTIAKTIIWVFISFKRSQAALNFVCQAKPLAGALWNRAGRGGMYLFARDATWLTVLKSLSQQILNSPAECQQPTSSCSRRGTARRSWIAFECSPLK